jgi:hypothetical protein
MLRLGYGFGSVLLALIIAALLVREPLTPDRQVHEQHLALRCIERNGSVLVDWDNSSPLVAGTTAAALEIVDGGLSFRRDVPLATVHRGGLAYKRRSGDVQLKLLLLNGSSVVAQPSVRLTGNATVRQP